MLNHIVIMGRLTRDPELRYTQSNTPVVSFRVAVDRDFQNRETGERQTDFIDCVAWRASAEFVSKYFQKGSMAVVSGRLQMRDWTDRDGNKRTSAEIVADNVYFGESKRSREGNSGENYGGGYGGNGGYNSGYSSRNNNNNASNGFNSAPQGGNAFAELDDGDGELPF